MTDPRLDFLDRLQAATTQRMQQVGQVAEQVGAITGEATSPDRLVTVTVSPSGALLGLVLDDDATDLDAQDLAALVLATARTAAERAAGAMKDAVAPLEQPLLPGEGTATAPGSTSDGEPAPTKVESAAFDEAMQRADAVADRVEERVRGQR